MRRVLAAMALLVAGAACGTWRRPPPPYRPALPPLARDTTAEAIYARDCAWCHGNRGEGTSRGPSLRSPDVGPGLVDFVLRTGRMPLDDPGERMRHRPTLYTEAQIAAIVRYTATLGARGPSVPQPHPRPGLRPRGAELYFDNCAACHSTTGVGGALIQGEVPEVAHRRSGSVAPGLGRATPLEVAEAIRTGPGSMPAFGRGVLSDGDVDAIVSYVEYLHRPADRGGAAIGRIGPVAEGAVGWIVGLGLLLLVARWIGTTDRGGEA